MFQLQGLSPCHNATNFVRELAGYILQKSHEVQNKWRFPPLETMIWFLLFSPQHKNPTVTHGWFQMSKNKTNRNCSLGPKPCVYSLNIFKSCCSCSLKMTWSNLWVFFSISSASSTYHQSLSFAHSHHPSQHSHV